MKIKMKQQITGTRDGVRWPAVGETLTVPDIEGADLCSQSLAEPVAEAPKPEKRAAAKKAAPKKDA